MFVPVIRKLVIKRKSLIERALPVTGKIYVSAGDEVKPFDRLGDCTFSQNQTVFPESFKPVDFNSKTNKKFYYGGAPLGKDGRKKIAAPYNGYLILEEGKGFVFEEAETKFNLLAGVWGKVEKVIQDKSVLIKAQTKNLLMVASTDITISGELVVFPNPTQILEKYYLESFTKGTEGKIIYIGNHVDEEILKKAHDMGVGAVITGSADKETFVFAKNNKIGLGIVTGFGDLETPDDLFKFINLVAYRHVFFQGDRNTLMIPVPPESVNSQGVELKSDHVCALKKVKKGSNVFVLQKPNFGKIGIVDSMTESSILVKFTEIGKPEEVFLPNFYLFE